MPTAVTFKNSCHHLPWEWTDCIIDKIFKNIEIVKFITTALKSILKLVKLQSLVAKCCKMPVPVMLGFMQNITNSFQWETTGARPEWQQIGNHSDLGNHTLHALYPGFAKNTHIKSLYNFSHLFTQTHSTEVYICIHAQIHIFQVSPLINNSHPSTEGYSYLINVQDPNTCTNVS